MLYNQLPANIKDKPIEVFKKELRSFLIEKEYYYIEDYMTEKMTVVDWRSRAVVASA